MARIGGQSPPTGCFGGTGSVRRSRRDAMLWVEFSVQRSVGPREWEEMKEGDERPADESGRGGPGNIQALLARIKNGDEGAARELLTRYEPKIRLVVRRQLPRLLRSRFDSLDFLQSVWGSFFHKIRTGSNDLDEEQNLITF